MKKTQRLQELFHNAEVFTIAGAMGALQAKIVEMAGYECAYVGGGLASAVTFGVPDVGLVTMLEFVQQAGTMANAIAIPLISDSDQGFGNSLAVRRTVQTFIRAGVSGIHIEDTPVVTRRSTAPVKQVLPVDEAAGKLRAAIDAKKDLDADFIIIARSDARNAAGGSLESTIARLKAYEAAGADVVFPEGVTSRDELRLIRQAIKGPLLIRAPALKPLPDTKELASLGVAAAFYPALTVTPAIEAAWEFAHDFRKRGLAAQADYERRPKKYPMPGMFDMVGIKELAALEAKYAP